MCHERHRRGHAREGGWVVSALQCGVHQELLGCSKGYLHCLNGIRGMLIQETTVVQEFFLFQRFLKLAQACSILVLQIIIRIELFWRQLR